MKNFKEHLFTLLLLLGLSASVVQGQGNPEGNDDTTNTAPSAEETEGAVSDDRNTLTYTFNEKGTYKVCTEIKVGTGDDACYKTVCKEVEIKSGCQCVSPVPACGNISTATYEIGNEIFLRGGHVLVLTEVTSGAGNNLSGKGTVFINWLQANIECDFNDLQINAGNELCSGEINALQYENAPQYPTQWGINLAGEAPLTDNVIQSIADYAETNIIPALPPDAQAELAKINIGQELNKAVKEQIKPLRVPLGFNNVGGYTLAFSGFRFTSERNTFAGLMVFPIENYIGDPLAFEITNICFTNRGPGNPFGPGGSGGIRLRSDVKLQLTNKPTPDENMYMIIRSETPERVGTGFEFTSTCGAGKLDWCFRADIDFEFPRNWLLPIPDDGLSQVTANAQTEICNWSDWIVMTKLENCGIAASNGRVEMEVDMMAYDHSDLRNAFGMAFPPNYVGIQDETFQGFYLKQARMRFPYVVTYPDPNQALEVQLNDWIITQGANGGITGELLALNVLNYPEGNIVDMGVSIDEIKVNILNSNFIQAYIQGRGVLPLSKDEVSNALNYKILYGTGDLAEYDGFEFRLWPDGPIEFGILDQATLNLDQVSEGSVRIPNDGGLNGTELFFSLSGDMTLNQPFQINDKVIDVEFKEVTFQNLGGTYLPGQGTFTPNNNMSFGLSSPQKKMGKFPVSVTNFAFVSKPKQGKEVFRGGLSADIICNLSDKIGGSTNLGLIGAIEKQEDKAHKFKPTFVALDLNAISVYANLPAVQLNGSIQFINGNPVYGDGFEGKISARFNSIGMEVTAGVLFGNTTYNANERYRYWKAEAKAILPTPGIVFLPGLAFRGFGVGAYRHMLADFSEIVPINGPATASSGEGGAVFKDAVFTPDLEKSFGFKIMGVVATTPKDETFNADIGISGEFTSSGGMSYLRFDGDFYIGTKLTERTDPIANGTVYAKYDFPTKIFDMGALVSIYKYPVEATEFGFELLINGMDNEWYFKAGEPGPNKEDYNSVKVFGVSVYSYLMFGNNIPVPTNWMSTTRDGWSQAGLSKPLPPLDGSEAVNPDTQQGKGFAFGIAFNEKSEKTGHLFSRAYYKVGYTIGGELNLSLMEYSGLCTDKKGKVYNPIGMNGWRAKGNLALYGSFSVGGYITPKGRNGGCTKSTCWVYCCSNYQHGANIDLFSGQFGAYVGGAFPNPSYARGGVEVGFKVLGRQMTFNAEFEVGNDCTNTGSVSGEAFAQEDAAKDQETKLIVDVGPSGYYNVDTTQVLTALYGFQHDKEFDVAEGQKDGTIKLRTFKAVYSATLEEKEVGGTYTPVNVLNKGVNLIGQTEFIKGTGGTGNMQNLASPGAAAFIGDGSGANDTRAVPAGLAGGVGSAGNMQNPASPGALAFIGDGSGANDTHLAPAVQTGAIGQTAQQPTWAHATSVGVSWNTDPPDPGYGNLPPPPPPTINNLSKKRWYKFTVTAKLYEYVDGNWVIAKNNSDQPVSQTETTTFFTGTKKEALEGMSSPSTSLILNQEVE